MSANTVEALHERIVAQKDGSLVFVDRTAAHRTGLVHFCVHLICWSGESAFLQRRASSRRRNANAWTSTVSGHITADDAAGTSFAIPEIALRVAAAKALNHEFREELGIGVPSGLQLSNLGQVPSLSQTDDETCNCRAWVFASSVQALPWNVTDEVQELREFEIGRVLRALKRGDGLPGADGVVHPFADNFAPVFHFFVANHRKAAEHVR